MGSRIAVELAVDAGGLVFWFGWAYLANGMALRRSRRTKFWVWLAVLLGPLAILILKILPPNDANA